LGSGLSAKLGKPGLVFETTQPLDCIVLDSYLTWASLDIMAEETGRALWCLFAGSTTEYTDQPRYSIQIMGLSSWLLDLLRSLGIQRAWEYKSYLVSDGDTDSLLTSRPTTIPSACLFLPVLSLWNRQGKCLTLQVRDCHSGKS
jgi:hypothetical protein